MGYSAGTQILNSDSNSTHRAKHNTLAEVVGDISLLTTLVNSSIVGSINSLKQQVAEIITGSFALDNDTYLEANAFGGGTVNVLKVNTSDKIVFGAEVVTIVINGGTITSLSSPLSIANGGTASNTASGARTSLGLAIGTNVQAWNTKLDAIAALSPTADNFIVGNGSTWLSLTPSQVRTSLGLVIGTNVQAWNTKLDAIAALTPTNNSFVVGNGSTWVAKDDSEVKAALSLVVGTNIQAWNANLDTIAALSPTTDNFISGNGSAWVITTPSSARTKLGLVIGVNVQAWNTKLDAIAALTPTADNFIVGNGSTWTLKTPSDSRTSLGLGTIATQNSNSVSVTGGTVSGVAITGSTIDTLATGLVMIWHSETAPTGWLLLKGETIGNSGSGATYSSASYLALYTHYWNNLANAQAAVSGGRGASASADFSANKTLTLPDYKQKFPLGKSSSGTGSTLGGTGGTIDHSHTVYKHYHNTRATGATIAISGGSHSHPVNDPGHEHDLTVRRNTGVLVTSGIAIAKTDSGSDPETNGSTIESSTTGLTVSTQTHTHPNSEITGFVGVVTGGISGDSDQQTSTNNPPYLSGNFVVKI